MKELKNYVSILKFASGKERVVFHQQYSRKHNKYVDVSCWDENFINLLKKSGVSVIEIKKNDD